MARAKLLSEDGSKWTVTNREHRFFVQQAASLAKEVYNIISQLELNNVREDRWGVYHLVEDNAISRYQFAKKILSEFKTEGHKFNCKINSISSCNFNQVANRPLNSVLSTDKINHFFSLNG